MIWILLLFTYVAQGQSTYTPEKASSTTEYNAEVVSTNFTIPLLRVNWVDKNSSGAPTDRKANVSLFNSVGAGIGYYWGRLKTTTDSGGQIINSEMDNKIGFQTGFLFAANGNASTNTNIFAWTLGVSFLNFNVGYGYEFGSIGANEKRGFLTVAYGIPISKLIQGGFYVTKKTDLDARKNNTRGARAPSLHPRGTGFYQN